MRVHAIAQVASACVASAALTGTLQAAIIYVDDSAVGANDGTSWENAFNDLQDALTIAQAGDEIRVGQGLYKPGPENGSRGSTFNLVNGTVLQGGYAGSGAPNPDELDPLKHVTTLSGDLGSVKVRHVVTANAVDGSTQLRGFTIRDGNADFHDTDPGEQMGGGLRGLDASLAVADCNFTQNVAVDGGGVNAEGGAPLFERCRFEANTLLFSGSGYGAGLRCTTMATVSQCDFIGNGAMHGGGGIFGPAVLLECNLLGNGAEFGGAVDGGTTLAIRCTFRDNFAAFAGGAADGLAFALNCSFLGNSTLTGAEGGGAIANVGTAINCLFSGNSSQDHGGAIATNTGTIINCTFVGNTAGNSQLPDRRGGGVHKFGEGALQVSNCIFRNNEDDSGASQGGQVYVSAGTADLNHNSIQGWDGSLGGSGNTGADPQFIDADGPDNTYGTEDDNPRLSETSPARDSGSNTYLPNDEHDLDDDGDTTEILPLDLDLMQRLVGGTVDMGAFEVQKDCPADISPSPALGDGQVTVMDLLAVINGWGDSGVGNPGDINGDGQVDNADLMRVIEDWGACR